MNYNFQSVNRKSGRLAIDSHNIENGFFFAAITSPSIKKLKLRITKKENEIQTFNLNQHGKFEIFPLQFGNGLYSITLYENVEQNRYKPIGNIKLDVKLKNDKISFIAPNQYINYDQIPQLIQIAKQLGEGKTNREKFNALKKYISSSYHYDFIKAATVKKDALPDIKNTLTKKSGICLDLAALVVALLRIMGIPAKLTIGMADRQYHAWVQLYIDGKVIRYDPTADISAISKVKTYITERTY